MKTTILAAVATTLLAAAGTASATTWNFADYGTGDQGTTNTFTSDDGIQLTAFSAYCSGGVAVGSGCSLGPDLWYKNGGPGETGLGLANDDDYEILPHYGIGLIPTGALAKTPFRIELGSLAGGDQGKIVEYGVSGIVSVLQTITGGANTQWSNWLTLANPNDAFMVIDMQNNKPDNDVLIESVTAKVPEPAALGLLGLGVVGLAMARRRRV